MALLMYSLCHDRRPAGRMGVAGAVQAHKGASRTLRTPEGFLSTHEFLSLGSVRATGIMREKYMLRRKQSIKPGKLAIRSSVSSIPTITKTGKYHSSLNCFYSPHRSGRHGDNRNRTDIRSLLCTGNLLLRNFPL